METFESLLDDVIALSSKNQRERIFSLRNHSENVTKFDVEIALAALTKRSIYLFDIQNVQEASGLRKSEKISVWN